ncbi:MAG: alpha/beta fold hydrolase [Acidimicrobiales bacterium]
MIVTIGGGELEVERIDGRRSDAPPLVFLHQGLGSVALWRSFPSDVVAATGNPAVVYSRHGYGLSAVVRDPRRPRYMHDEGLAVLPEVRARIGLDRRPPILVGHSDGASIAIIHAGAGRWPVAGLVLLAPHVFVEDRSIAGIEAARTEYLTTDMPERVAKYHADADATFWGWNDIWLSPTFRGWNIEEFLPGIDCPVLVVQGEDDEFGTTAQVDAVAQGVAGPVEVVLLPDCRHSPHLDQPEATLEAVARFVSGREP